MHPLKAPGPDGFQSVVYRHYWDMVEENIIKLVQEIFRKRAIPKGINNTFIVLIQKTPRLRILTNSDRLVCVIFRTK